jgi:hypothetical protein
VKKGTLSVKKGTKEGTKRNSPKTHREEREQP